LGGLTHTPRTRTDDVYLHLRRDRGHLGVWAVMESRTSTARSGAMGSGGPQRVGPVRSPGDRIAVVAVVVAASIAVFAWLAGWRGGDLSAQLFRVALYRRNGLTLWNPQWYSGHFTLSYSLLYPPVAATVGIVATTVLSAGLSAWCFAQLARRWFGPQAHVGIVLFALGIGSQIAIGQLPFLMGEAFALASCTAIAGRRWARGGLLAVAATLSSPLAGAFLLLVLLAWALAVRRDRLRFAIVAVVAGLPVLVASVLFPGTGAFPYPSTDALPEMAIIGALLALVARRSRALRIGTLLYLGAMAASFVVQSPMGGNVSRLAESVAIPLSACVLWPARRTVLAVMMVPLLWWQWTPAVPAMTTQSEEPSTHAAYYAPVLGYFASLATPPARVEVVPTNAHYEAAYVAPTIPIARGWERQVDIAENPIFYRAGALDAATFRAWLLDTGVQYVAVSNAPLDYASVNEAALVRAGIPGLTATWHDQDWQVYAVDGSTGIVDGPATLDAINGDRVDVNVQAPGDVTVRVRFNRNWDIEPEPTCFGPDANGWITFNAATAGPYTLTVHLTPTQTGLPPCNGSIALTNRSLAAPI
jgi:hypothetical protein